MANVKVVLDEKIGQVNRNIFGHFAEHLGRCIYEGIYVGEDSKIPNTRGIRNDVIEALKKIRPSVLRWPGGCFADDYHWTDGIGPRNDRRRTVNIHWGSAIDTNQFGTHEFIDLCRLVGAEPYISANVGSGNPREARDWVEYCNFAGDSSLAQLRKENGSADPFNVRYWGVGNELWGCGGAIPPEDYALEVRRFSTYMRGFGTDLYKIACGPRGNDPYEFRRDWVLKFFENLQPKTISGGCRSQIDGFALHYYTRGDNSGDSVNFTDEQYYWLIDNTYGIDDRIRQVRAAMDAYDPDRKVGLIIDEWGTWYPEAQSQTGLEQQNTMRDALIAAINLDIFVQHADKVVMTNIAQTINVLQALILTAGEKMLLTPTYHVFDMYKRHQDATSLRVLIDAPSIESGQDVHKVSVQQVSGSASMQDGTVFLTLTNVDAKEDVEVNLDLYGMGNKVVKAVRVNQLAGQTVRGHNTFDNPDRVKPVGHEIESVRSSRIVLPAHSVSAIEIDLA